MIDEILFFTLPLLLSASIHHAFVIPKNILSFLAHPVDCGLAFKGKRLFGAAKAWRGFVLMTILTALFTVLLNLKVALYPAFASFLVGAALGFGYSLGELPNSFLKRRLDIKPSARGAGWYRIAFDCLDHTDSIMGALLVVILVHSHDPKLLAILFLIGVSFHWLGDLLVRRFSYKSTLQ